MASIQSLGIIHHDLKSANVLLEQVELAPGRYVLRGKKLIIIIFFFPTLF